MPSAGGTTDRGYGSAHRKLRQRHLAELKRNPGQPCPRCGQPMFPDQDLDLDHTDDRAGYQGLAHLPCNRAAGARTANRNRARRATPQPRTWTTSRDW